MRPRLYTITTGRPFLATLAAGLLGLCGGDPLRLARAVVLLPTRRAVRALREAFLQVAPAGGVAGTPLLLPRLYSIGDLDDEATMPGAGDDDVPPALSVLRRHLLLTRLVLKWGERRSRDALLPGQAAALAATLARLIDTVASEGASFAGLADLVPADLAEHWQVVQRFLEILPQAWPQMLAAEGALDLAERRNRLLRRQAQAWRRLPPAAPVIAAGLAGGMPAVTELLATVAALPAGAVILAGFDRDRDDTEWQAIAADEAHPQHLLALLLQTLDLHPSEVQDWPPAPLAASGEKEKSIRRRLALVAEALRPAATTDAWRRLPPEPADTFAGVSRYDCPSAQQEAVTIALLLRRKLETPGATAALVTPDRDLARRVAAELRRWGIAIDDSAGLPLNRTPPGVFLRLVLELAGSRLAPVPLLATLAHPLAAGGMPRARFRDLARRLERAIRGPRPAPGFAGLKAALAQERAQEGAQVRRFVATLESCLGALPQLLAAPAVALAELARAHVAAAEHLAASDEEPGGARLWREAAGEIAARFCHELIDAAKDFPPLPGRHYPALFEALAADTVVRPAFGRHPRLAIWGLIEARLQQADLIVLGGLNEGSWPAAAEHDPWMSRQMRRAFGIAVPERAIGIAAHDFAQALGAAEVALTRATRQEGVPTVPSRWLLRLDTVLRAIGCVGALAPDPEIESAAALIDERTYRPLPPAQFCPPLATRPRHLSVTEVETWMRDPYAIYARHVLRLRPLDPLDADPGRAELGTVIHRALEIFVTRFPRALPEQAEQELIEIGRECFAPFLSRPGAWAFWWPRFEKIARWFVAEERRHRAAVVESLSECRGSLVLPSRGGPFTITAKADRIDRLAAGGFLLADYKTGILPRKKEVEAGLAPQLTLEGAILRNGGFAGIAGEPGHGPSNGDFLRLEYWRLSGGEPAGERQALSGDDAGALIAGVLDRVRTLIAHFDDPATPYLATPAPQWAPRFSDYDHLERLTKSETAEWE
jgi:ATP-dependent helicase/nuclease subunit B